MRLINLLSELIEAECTGCTICAKVCPTLSIEMARNDNPNGPKYLPVINAETCVGCWACEQRCPFNALHMVRREPYTIGVSVKDVDREEIYELCEKAHLNPDQVVCFCTVTRAEEIAAAILKGARTPEAVSSMTGARTGCKVECIQPILRLLEAAGAPLDSSHRNGWQVYGRTITAWEIPQEVKARYASRGFYFDSDLELLKQVSRIEPKEEENAPAD
jgi:ferredoxin